jgi:ABC-type sugar transport system ATPase subunit
MSRVELRGVTKRYGITEVVHGIDLDIAHGEFVVFVGPSGCGKSTLLRMICGLEPVSGGEVLIDGKSMRGVAPAKRGVAMVFQSYALYPHMNVAANMGFSLRMSGIPAKEREAMVRKAAAILQLEELLDRLPKELSGGQRQRVAIGRAIVREPDVFLFDEPLSNLDAALRVQMRIEIGKLHQDLKSTMIYVTHDQVEAMTMADKIVVLNAGLIEQVGSPLELYHRPRNTFVAGFIGSPKMNFLKTTASMQDGKIAVALPGGGVTLDAQGTTVEPNQAVTLGIRPEHITPGGTALKGTVRLAEYLGSETMFYLALADGSELSVKADGLAKAAFGETLGLAIPPAACHLFDASGRTILNGDLTR